MGIFRRARDTSQQQPALEQPSREAALFAFSRKLVGAAGVGEIAQALFRAIDDLLDVDQCVLLGVNEEQTHATGIAAMVGMDAQVASISVALEEDTSAVAQVVRDRAPHRVLDGQRESLHSRQLADLLGIRSALYVPLQTSGGVIAVAVLATTDRPRAFRREEVDLIQTLANEAAVAIERARLAQTLREVGERELIVASVARSIRESLDPAQVLRTAARELGEQADADRVLVCLMGSDQLDGRACEWTPTRCEVIPFDRSQLTPAATLALDDRQTVTARAQEAQAPAATAVTVPLAHHEELVGVLTLERAHVAFEPAEVRLVELIGVEIAAALDHVRLYHGGRKHLDEQLALARAAQSLTADLRFDRVLEHIVDEVVKLLRTQSAAFYTYDRDEQALTLRAAFGEAEQQAVGEKMGLIGLAGRVVRSGVSQLTNEYEHDLAGEIHPVFAGIRQAISVPVRWQGDLRGVISVAGRDSSRRFSEHDVGLLEAFADLASLALHNADAYSAHSRQARIQAGFYRISQVLSSSLSRTRTLSALAQAATEALDADWALVVGGDGVEEELHVEGQWDAPDEVLAVLGDLSTDPFAGSPAQLAIQQRRVVTSRSVRDDDRLGEQWRTLLDRSGVVAQLAVPVSVHGRHSAVVVVGYSRPVRFGDEELVVAGNLANAASAALERAGLFENERRTRRLSEVLADVSALLAETLKTQTVLERIVEQAAVLLEVDACMLATARPGAATNGEDADVAELRVHAASGSDDALVAVLHESPVGGLVEEVARTKRSLSVEELASETSGQVLGDESYDSFLGVPLRHPRGHLIGVLCACSRQHRAWSSAEIASLESFASSAAIAIRNAELYADIKRERDTIEKLLASIAEGIVATDAVGRITLWNHAAETITGVTREQVTGRSWRDVFGLAAETLVPDGQSVIEARPAGVSMWLSVTASRLRERGQDAGAIYAFRDVSADYTLDRLKSDFVSTVSYVFRTPLTSIYGFAQTLLREDLQFDDDDRRVFLGYIATETERLTAMVDDLLEVARIDAGSVDVHVADCDLGGVIDEAVRSSLPRLGGRDVRVAASPDTHHVRADAGKLRAVIGNLILNAARYSPAGGDVQISTERDNGAVQIHVIDEGEGIPIGEQKNLFTKFYVSPTAESDTGSGLGLYISKGLVDAMGGRIWVSSQPGAGSTFTVELPAASEGPTH